MLVGLKEVCEEARKRGIAVGSFNTPNTESLIAVLEAAEKLDLPIIIAHAQCHESVAPLDRIGPCMVALAKKSSAKVCVHLDHGEDFDYVKRAIAHGFTSVMIDYSTLSYEDNLKGTREVVEYAHANGVAVEAELGALPQREGGGDSSVKKEDLYTRSELVEEFVSKTDVDALAIAFGTAHGIYKEKPQLNFDIITKVREKTDVPLVMHGGSGISHEEYREVIRRGITKINYYTYMAYEGYNAAKNMTAKIQSTFYHDLASEAKNAMGKNVEETLKVFANIE